MKTSRPKARRPPALIIALVFFSFLLVYPLAAVTTAAAAVAAVAAAPAALASGMNRFACLSDLLPLTSHALLQGYRKGFEEPFLVNAQYLVFPEVANGKLSGLFIFDSKHAWHYDSVAAAAESENEPGAMPVTASIPISALVFDSSQGIFDLVAQPNGLETVTVSYLPGFNPLATDKDGPVILGASVLPVVGAFVSRPEQRRIAYFNPARATDGELKKWFLSHGSGRRPAENPTAEVKRTIRRLHLTKAAPNDWHPLQTELDLRRQWIQDHNLDEATFRQLSRVMESTCKAP